MEVQKVERIDGYPTVIASRITDVVSGGYTDIQFRYIAYDLGMPADVFSERSLRSPPSRWLQRPGN